MYSVGEQNAHTQLNLKEKFGAKDGKSRKIIEL